jgi:hypothetical protein
MDCLKITSTASSTSHCNISSHGSSNHRLVWAKNSRSGEFGEPVYILTDADTLEKVHLVFVGTIDSCDLNTYGTHRTWRAPLSKADYRVFLRSSSKYADTFSQYICGLSELESRIPETNRINVAVLSWKKGSDILRCTTKVARWLPDEDYVKQPVWDPECLLSAADNYKIQPMPIFDADKNRLGPGSVHPGSVVAVKASLLAYAFDRGSHVRFQSKLELESIHLPGKY